MTIEAVRALGKANAKEPFVMGPFTPMWDGVVVSFDQSLAHNGCVTMHVFEDEVVGLSTRMFETDSDFSGHEGNLRRAEAQYRMVSEYLDLRHPDLIIHETPPAGGRMARPESSLLAAFAVRRAAIEAEIPFVMIGAQKAKKRLTGNANCSKAELRDAVRLALPGLTTIKPNNEHTCDAAALAVVAFESKEHRP